MSAVIHARVVDHLTRLRLRYVADRLDTALNDAARSEPTYLDFLDSVLRQEVDAKQRDPRGDGPQDRALPDGEDARPFRFQISALGRSAGGRELATGLLSPKPQTSSSSVLRAWARRTWRSRWVAPSSRPAGHSVLCTSATALLAALAKAETEGQLADRLLFYSKPRLLIIDELGYLPFERRSAHLFFQLVARRYERGSLLITTNQVVTQWGAVLGDEVLAAAILDRLLHHSHTQMIQGESYRLKQKKKASLLGKNPTSRV